MAQAGLERGRDRIVEKIDTLMKWNQKKISERSGRSIQKQAP